MAVHAGWVPSSKKTFNRAAKALRTDNLVEALAERLLYLHLVPELQEGWLRALSAAS